MTDRLAVGGLAPRPALGTAPRSNPVEPPGQVRRESGHGLGSVRNRSSQEGVDLGRGAQDDDPLLLPELREAPEDRAATTRRIGPDPHQELPAQSLRTTGRELGPIAPEGAQPAHEHSPETEKSRQVQEYHRVTREKAGLQG